MSGEGGRDGRWWLPAIIALLPTGGYAWAEVEELKERPVLLAVVTVLWALLSAVFGIAGALAERWRPGVVDWCDVRVRSHWHQSKHRYLEWVGHRNRDFDVKGLSTQGHLSLELAKVFVDLRLVPRPVHQSGGNPIAPPTATVIDAPADLTLSQAVGHHALLAILGPPGSGKTTLLRHAALVLTGPKSFRVESGLPEAVPVLIFLREVAPLLASATPPSLVDVVAAGTRGLELDRAWLTRELAARRCLLMLDGLDEVADAAARTALVQWIEDQVAGNPGNRWIVTARPFGYQSNPIAGFSALSVQPLRRAQIELFLDHWYLANEVMAAQREDDGVIMKAEEGAADLLDRIDRSPVLVRLAVNPLLLTLIANVHRWRSSLPGRRIELYGEICEVFLGKRQEARGLTSSLTPGQKKLVLQSLAWNLMSTRRRELPEEEAGEVVRDTLERVSPGSSPSEFFRTVQSGSGLLLEREAGIWGFAHKTFQEYLAALHAHERGHVHTLVDHVADDWWHETIRLYSAIGDATNIIAACMTGDPPRLQALVLALQCAEEAREVDPKVRADLLRLVDQELDSEDPGHRRLAAECRLELRVRAMDRVEDAVFADRKLLTNAEYQLFVMAEAEAGRPRQPDHWQGREFPAGKAREPALGVRGVDALAFCAWLSSRDGGDWTCRLPNHHEFMDLEDEQLPSGAGYWFIGEDGSIKVWSTGVDDDMDMLASRFEQVVAQDLHRVAELPAEERARLGLEVSDREVQVLISLATWADAGGIRVGARILNNAIDMWPTTVWWRTARFVIGGVGFVLSGPYALLRLMLRGWLWTLSRVGGAAPEVARERVAQAIGRSKERLASLALDIAVWLMRPLAWLMGPPLRRLFKDELEGLVKPPSAAEGALTPWSRSALERVIEESGDDEAQMRSFASLVLLVMTQFVGGFTLQFVRQIPARGTAILALSRRPDTPAPLAKLARALAERGWDEELDGPAVADLSWATRVSLLLWWRHGIAASFMALARRRGHFTFDAPKHFEVALLEAWFDAWAIGERSAGKTVPFEGIRIVKERRHVD
jgi:hypothetical protein